MAYGGITAFYIPLFIFLRWMIAITVSILAHIRASGRAGAPRPATPPAPPATRCRRDTPDRRRPTPTRRTPTAHCSSCADLALEALQEAKVHDTMSDTERIAREYFAARSVDPAHLKRELDRLITDDFLWQTSGYPDVRGRAAMIDLIDRQAGVSGYARSEIDILRLATGDGYVLTERVDTVFDADGAVLAAVALMGRLDIRDGKVSAHRDYFDPTNHHMQ
jgi:limonene-1,2-epoxide hydrolase